MQKGSRFAFSSALAAGLILSIATAAFAADPIEERVKQYKGAKQSVAQIKDAIAAGDNALVASGAKSLSDLGGRIPSLFPEGSDKGKTDAKPEIWANFADFSAKAKGLQDSAGTLAQLASAGASKDQLSAAFGATLDSCKACHRSYKKD